MTIFSKLSPILSNHDLILGFLLALRDDGTEAAVALLHMSVGLAVPLDENRRCSPTRLHRV